MPAEYPSREIRYQGKKLQRNNPVRKEQRTLNRKEFTKDRKFQDESYCTTKGGLISERKLERPSRIPRLKRPLQQLHERTSQIKEKVKRAISPTNFEKTKSNTLPARINAAKIYIDKRKASSLQRPETLKSENFANEKLFEPRVPIRRKKKETLNTISSPTRQATSKKSAVPKKQKRKTIYVKAERKHSGTPLLNSNRPIPSPRRTFDVASTKNTPIPKPRKTRISNVASDSPPTKPKKVRSKNTTWPRKISPSSSHKIKRSSFRYSYRTKELSTDFKPVWLPVGTLSRSKHEPSSPNTTNILRHSKRYLSKAKPITTSRKSKSTNKQINRNGHTLSNKKQHQRRRVNDKSTAATLNRPLWLPTGKSGILPTLPKSTKQPTLKQHEKSKPKLLQNKTKYRDNNCKENKSNDVDINNNNSCVENDKLENKSFMKIKRSLNHIKNANQARKRKHSPANTNNSSVVVNKNSYSPLFVKPLSQQSNRQTNTGSSSSRERKLLWLPPSNPAVVYYIDGKTKLRRRTSKIPIRVNNENAKKRPLTRILWLPASKYTRLQSHHRRSSLHRDNVKPFLITV